MSKQAYTFPDDFKEWQQMHQTPSGPWIYFSPDNLLAALIDIEQKIVLIIMERYSNTVIYENKEKIRAAALRIKMKTRDLINPVNVRRLV